MTNTPTADKPSAKIITFPSPLKAPPVQQRGKGRHSKEIVNLRSFFVDRLDAEYRDKELASARKFLEGAERVLRAAQDQLAEAERQFKIQSRH